MKKRIIATLLAGVMALSLAACGGTTAAPAAPAEPAKEEAAAEEILRTELGFALQPGYNPGTMVNDLKFLIKQGATHEQLSALISDKLAVQMTPRIEDALRRAEAETVRWQSTATRRLN